MRLGRPGQDGNGHDGSVCQKRPRKYPHGARRQIDAGIHFIAPCGTTGENPTLTRAERIRIVEILAEESAGRVPVLAGEHSRKSSTDRVVTLPNALSALRLLGVPLFLWLVLTERDVLRALDAGPGGALEAFVEARAQGLVRFLGVTGHGVQTPAMHRRSLERFPTNAIVAHGISVGAV